MKCEVGIVGAGVAGLSAALALRRAGVDARCLEATERIGGRIFTVHDAASAVPIELGAEFVHGRPGEIWDLIRGMPLAGRHCASGAAACSTKAATGSIDVTGEGMAAYEHTAQAIRVAGGRIVKYGEPGEAGDAAIEEIAKSKRRRDESFDDFLRRSRHPRDWKAWARVYVEGFNAARSDTISAQALVQESEAAEMIEGDRTFKIAGGYDSIPAALARSMDDSVVVRSAPVTEIQWQKHSVQMFYRAPGQANPAVLRCRQAIVTAPLGVLQAVPESIRFDPEPSRILEAARSLRFGQVYRITFRFGSAFWEEDRRLGRAGFLISRDPAFFTWWTTHPMISPLLTGWMAGSAAERFLGAGQARVVSEALRSLGRILGRKIPRPEAFYFHDWHNDPFFRGAYSYVPVDALPARRTMAEPAEDTLFFAGEATDFTGHGGTVHGAMASGLRAAAQVQGGGRRCAAGI